ncbi:ecotin, putative [Leishmania donovani]|uniref:Ecotin-like protein 3 n=1 Tax=Leishmania donovani TaxID=5661 RepID=E9BC95_LEIDO|nr:ecotin, putative [Leishmania donovani]AYU77467.1 ecotin, putative [Leishmania donovani]CBZ32871.1 ecotin, putative [Leishmania donovani]
MPSLQDYHVPYPAAAPGQVRKVIYLPQQNPTVEQQHLRVQIIPGRHENCEDGRLYKLTGSVTEETLQGWGYSYYVVKLGDIYAAHRSSSDPARVTTFVALDENPVIAYNSKLPIVVYVPEGAELRYRIWTDDTSLVQSIQQQPEAPALPQPHLVPVTERQECPHELPRCGAPGEYVTQDCKTSMLSVEEVHRLSSSTPPLIPSAVRGSAHEAHAAPPLHSAELEERVCPVMEHLEVCPQNNGHEGREQPAEEASTLKRRSSSSSSSNPRHLSANEPSPSRPRLSSTEYWPQENSKTKRSPSATHKPRRSTDSATIEEAGVGAPKKNRSSSSSASSKKKAEDNVYEKTMKNFWNRARSDSPRKASASSKKSGNGSKADP